MYLEIDGKSIVQACPQDGFQTGKNFGSSKVTVVVLISHFKEMLIVIFRIINCNEKRQATNCWFFSWFSTEIQYWNRYFDYTPQKLNFFTLFERYSWSMLPWESKFDGRFLFMVFNEKIFWVVQQSVHLRLIWF